MRSLIDGGYGSSAQAALGLISTALIVATVVMPFIAPPVRAALWERPGHNTYWVSVGSDASKRAGAHPTTLSIDISGFSEDLSRIKFKLPQGMANNRLATPACTSAQFRRGGGDDWGDCPRAATIGDFYIYGAGDSILNEVDAISALFIDDDELNNLRGTVYQGTPPAGGEDPPQGSIYLVIRAIPEDAIHVPDRFEGTAVDFTEWATGRDLPGRYLKIECNAYVRDEPYVGAPGQDGGVDVDCPLPQRYMWLPISLKFTFLGALGGDRDHHLITNPTACNFEERYENYCAADFKADFYESGRLVDSNLAPAQSYQLLFFRYQRFAPRLEFKLDDPAPNTATAMTVTTTQGYGEAHIKETRVALPPGFKVVTPPSLGRCSPAAESGDQCPESSRVGSVVASSTQLEQPLKGSVYLLDGGDQRQGPIRMAMFLHGFIDIRLVMESRLENFSSGPERIVTTVEQPQLAVGEFKVILDGGRMGLIRTPSACGARNADVRFTAHAGMVIYQRRTIDISSNCPDPDEGGSDQSRSSWEWSEPYRPLLANEDRRQHETGPAGDRAAPAASDKPDRSAPTLKLRIRAKGAKALRGKGTLHLGDSRQLSLRGSATDLDGSGVEKISVELSGACTGCRGNNHMKEIESVRYVKPTVSGRFNVKLPVHTGRYWLNVQAVDRMGNRSPLVKGKSSFRVRVG